MRSEGQCRISLQLIPITRDLESFDLQVGRESIRPLLKNTYHSVATFSVCDLECAFVGSRLHSLSEN